MESSMSWQQELKSKRARIDDLAAQITELAGHLNATNYKFLQLIAEFDNREGWADNATHSCAHWLNWKCGIDIGAAREKVRVAHALEKLPKLSAAMEKGQISYSKARAITRIACPDTEDYLLMIALHGTADHVERLVRHFRNYKEAEALFRGERQQAERELNFRYDETGALVIRARLPAEAGALFMKALDVAIDDLADSSAHPEAFKDFGLVTKEVADIKKIPFSVRRADALALLAESFLAHGAAAMNGGDKHQVVVHVDAETLRDRTAGRCELDDGPSIAAETARRVRCQFGRHRRECRR
jgi:hypothetical protein